MNWAFVPVGWPYAISLPYQSKALRITVSPVDLFVRVCSIVVVSQKSAHRQSTSQDSQRGKEGGGGGGGGGGGAFF